VSDSTFNFISDEGEGVKVYVEHGPLGPEANAFIHGIASDAWFGEVDDEDPEYHKKMNPTLRYWKKHERPKTPKLKLGKRKFGFIPPPSECLLGPEPQYEVRKSSCGHEYEVLLKHPACQCSRCLDYRWEEGSTWNFWKKVTGRVQVNV